MDTKKAFKEKQAQAELETTWLMFDSHMHIQSSHTTPLPLLWGASPGIIQFFTPRRRILDNLSVVAVGRQGGGADEGYLIFSEELIGRVVVEKNFITYYEDSPFMEKVKVFKSVFSPMIVMPMDMEYAHISGYPKFGSHTIYHTEKKVWYYKLRKNAIHEEKDGKDVLLKKESDTPRDEDKKEMTTKYLHQKYVTEDEDRYIEERLKIDNGVVKAERAEMFVGWRKQLLRTENAAYQNPFHLIPMYHYEPRRHMAKNKYWKKPFSKIVTKTNKGIFIGFKMYPPLGYKPNDFERMPDLDRFYNTCMEDEIPILAHCSPGGMVTHDADLYMDLDGYGNGARYFANIAKSKRNEFKEDYDYFEAAKKELDSQKGYDYSGERASKSAMYQYCMDKLLRAEKLCYFANKYVSPSAWVDVLEKYKKLKLCMAHFGGDEWCRPFFGDREAYGSNESLWIKKIIDIIVNYENAYTDISCFFLKQRIRLWHRHDGFKRCRDVFGKFLEDNKKNDKVLSKILLGTDWYLIKITNRGYGKDEDDYEGWINLMKEFLDDIDEGLWVRFSMINPCKFFGFDNPKKIENMAEILYDEAPNERIEKEVKKRKQYFLGLAKEGSESAKGNLEQLEKYILLKK